MSAVDIFLHHKPRKVLRFIKNKRNVSILDVAQNTDTTYAHTFNLIKKLESAGILETSKAGRKTEISITDKGIRVCRLIDEIERTVRSDADFKQDKGIEKLEYYRDRVKNVISRDYKKDCRNMRMILGRYRQIIRKMRPKSKKGKELRGEILREIEDALCRLRK